jgi:hypothetical protein
MTILDSLADPGKLRRVGDAQVAPGGGIPIDLTLDLVRQWRSTCDGLAESLDGLMFVEMSRTLGIPPW